MALLPKKDTPLVPKAEDLRVALEDSNKQAQDYRDKAEQPTWQYEGTADTGFVTTSGEKYLVNGGTFTSTTSYPVAVNVEAGREYTVDFSGTLSINFVSGTTAGDYVTVRLRMLQGSTSTIIREARGTMAFNSGTTHVPVHLHAVVTPKSGTPAHFAVTLQQLNGDVKTKIIGYHGLTVTPRLAKVGKDTKR